MVGYSLHGAFFDLHGVCIGHSLHGTIFAWGIILCLCKSKARTVPSREQLSTTLPEALKQTPVTPEECSENVTKQNPDVVFHSFT